MAKYSISEVAALTNCTKRTIRYYVQLNLIPPPVTSGRNSFYDDNHVRLIKLIKKLQDEYLPLSKIKDIIDDKKNLNRYLKSPGKSPAGSPEFSAVRQRMIRVSISPDVEIHFKDYLPGTLKNKIEKIINFSVELFNSEGSLN